MHTTWLSLLTLVPAAAADIWGTCTPKITQPPSPIITTYPTILTEVHSCTHNYSSVILIDPVWTQFSNHEQTLTTLAPFPSAPTTFPWTHVVTVYGVLSRTEWVGSGSHQTFISTVTDVETVVMGTGTGTEGVLRAEATGV